MKLLNKHLVSTCSHHSAETAVYNCTIENSNSLYVVVAEVVDTGINNDLTVNVLKAVKISVSAKYGSEAETTDLPESVEQWLRRALV